MTRKIRYNIWQRQIWVTPHNTLLLQVFKETGRPDVEDVIVLITDGEPLGKSNTEELTKQYAQDLKESNILIVAAGVGEKSKTAKFRGVLMELATSQDFFIEAQFDQMDKILKHLVEKCIKPGRSYFAIAQAHLAWNLESKRFFLETVRNILSIDLVLLKMEI